VLQVGAAQTRRGSRQARLQRSGRHGAGGQSPRRCAL